MTPWTTSYNRILYLDLETFSDIDITRGVYKYSSSNKFDILLCSYALDEEEVKTFCPLNEKFPKEFIEALFDEKTLKVAHNAIFERVCLSRYLLKSLTDFFTPKGWCCTLGLASILGLPKSLDDVCKYFGLSAKEAKAKTLGTRLINFFSKPIEPKRTNNFRVRNYPENDPDKRSDFCFYNKQDVVSLRVIFKKMMAMVDEDTLNHEFPIYELDQHINDLGVRVDMRFIDSVLDFLDKDTARNIAELKELTGLDNPNSRVQLLPFLQKYDDRLKEMADLTKDTVAKYVLDFSTKNDAKAKRIYRILTLVQAIKKTSNAKYIAMKESAIEENGIYKCHGTTAYYSAVTGRWGGRIVQVQNLVRNSLRNIGDIKEIVKEGDFETIELLFDSPTQVVSELIRTAFIPSQNARFVVCDYNAIESRVAAWLANEKWKVEAFIEGKGIYEETASKMFKVPREKITHDSPLRAKGKVAELAGQYQGGVGAYKAMGADKLGLKDEEIQELVKARRNENKNIVEMWNKIERGIYEAIQLGSIIAPKEVSCELEVGIDEKDKIKFVYERDTHQLRIVLPSGRSLYYQNARIKTKFNKVLNKEVGTIVYEGESRTNVGREDIEMYGGKFFENIVQAIARDCLAEAMLALEKENLLPSFHVHDEVIISVDYSRIKSEEEAIKRISTIMAKAAGNYKSKIPLKAAGYSCEFYLKD